MMFHRANSKPGTAKAAAWNSDRGLSCFMQLKINEVLLAIVISKLGKKKLNIVKLQKCQFQSTFKHLTRPIE